MKLKDILNEGKVNDAWELQDRLVKELKSKYKLVKLSEKTFDMVKTAIIKSGTDKTRPAYTEDIVKSKFFNKRLANDVANGNGQGAQHFIMKGSNLIAIIDPSGRDTIVWHEHFKGKKVPFTTDDMMYELKPEWFVESVYKIVEGDTPDGFRGSGKVLMYVKAKSRRDAELKSNMPYADAYVLQKADVAVAIKAHEEMIKKEQELLKQLKKVK